MDIGKENPPKKIKIQRPIPLGPNKEPVKVPKENPKQNPNSKPVKTSAKLPVGS
jgi:hypothetical protein